MVAVRVEIIDPRTNTVLAEEGFTHRGAAGSWAMARAWARSGGTVRDRRAIEQCWELTKVFSVPVDVGLTGPVQTAIRVTTT
ncbi:MAG: hypothetical protein WAX14_12230 [Rhodococcus sp. (in: high G+C Gram-positive bacteria)]|uniref:hypothetical protein n=1 Tax=Rhodococcus sp. TaxID=1831 RepID=UPI003BB7D6C4